MHVNSARRGEMILKQHLYHCLLRLKLQRHHYHVLDRTKKEIRLLILEPSGKTPSGVVQCTLHHTSLMDEPLPAYETISYVWGDPSLRSTIIVDKCVLDVPASAEQVLRNMRCTDRTRTLWIDAVCINQMDFQERGHQVAIMADIYANTVHNFIWLSNGSDCPDRTCTARAGVAIDRIYEDAKVETSNFTTFQQAVKYEKIVSKDKINPRVLADEDWLHVLHYLASPWFARLWVVQEAALPRSSTFCYQDSRMPLPKVLRAAVWLFYRRRTLPIKVDGWSLYRHHAIWLYSDHECGLSSQQVSDDCGLINLLLDLQSFRALDSRDHVYGMLGLWQRLNDRSGVPHLLTPDYSKPLWDVLRDATVATIHSGRNLECLRCTVVRDPLEGHIPNWVLRIDRPWDRKQDPAWLEDSTVKCCGRREHIDDTAVVRNDAITSRALLPVRGMVVDNVGQLMLTITYGSPASSSIKTLLKLKNDVLECPDHGRCTLSAVAAVLSAQGADYGFESDQKRLEGCSAWFEYLEKQQEFPDMNVSLSGLPLLDDSRYAQVIAFHRAFVDACTHRMLFWTSDGRLGVGPKSMMSSDLVVVLWGSLLPVILRPLTFAGRFAFLGCAFVHGMMHGELIDCHEEAFNLKEQTFHLQ
ncbi:HET-domain-containing protein [Teratosphaeria destructans]|uniref:HET-domain-containing protein n=1 Tax=Teratosphaeria destructans TaxID=418781 RepID=A0A9W7SIC7_9PEZI|nr:HET-domain-containing protein [Teratosphaeria destructans]